MRIRTIKPSFFHDEEIADLDPLCRLLFQGLWLMADSEGRLEDRPRRIKAEVLPYDECDVDAMLEILHERRFIIRYEAADKACIQVRNFLKHQRISGKEAAEKSTIPPEGSNGEATGKQLGSTGEATGKHPESQEGKGKEGKGKERNTPCARDEISESDTSELSCLANHSWQRFRGRFPERDGKFQDEDACRAKWARSPAMWNTWNACLDNYLPSRDVLAGFPCTPMTFLARRWRDYVTPAKPTGQGPPPAARDTSWRDEREQDEAVVREQAEAVKSGAVAVRPRDRLPFERPEEYEAKLAAGTLPMVPDG
jgi:hypothetical protein